MKRIFLLCLICVPLVMCGQSIQSDSLYSVAVDLYHNQKYMSAAEIFQQVLDLDSKELDPISMRQQYAIHWLASCYYRTGQKKEARKYFPFDMEPVDRRLTVRSDSLLTEGMRKIQDDSVVAALNDFNKAIELECNVCGEDSYFVVGTYKVAAQCYLAIQQYSDSRNYFEKAFKIEEQYISSKDTLLLNSLDALYTVNIHLKEYSAAEKANNQAYEIISSNYPAGHVAYINALHRKLALAMYQDDQEEAGDILPKYVDALKAVNTNQRESVLEQLINLKSDFEHCGFASQSHYVTQELLSLCKTYEDRINVLTLQFVENLADPVITSKVETELCGLCPSRTSANYTSHVALVESLKVLRYLSAGDIDNAKKSYLTIKKDALDKYLDKMSVSYRMYLSAKHNIAVLLSDYESSADALSEFIALVPDDSYDKDFYRAVLACSYAFAGNFEYAKDITDEVIRALRNRAGDERLQNRYSRDEFMLDQIINYIDNIKTYDCEFSPEARYNLNYIKSSYLQLELDMIKVDDKDRYPVCILYYEVFERYIYTLLNMRKYAEAYDKVNEYMNEWRICYNDIDPNSTSESDIFDRVLAYLPYGDALMLMIKCCNYDERDATAVYQELCDFLKSEYGKDSGDYIDAIARYYLSIGDFEKLNEFFSEYENLPARHYKTLAHISMKKNDMSGYKEYLQQYVCKSIGNPDYVRDSLYEWANTLDVINKQYVESKDTVGMMDFYSQVLWQKIDPNSAGAFDLLMHSIYKMGYEMDNDFFVGYINNTFQEKYPSLDKRYGACVNQAIAGVFYFSKQYEKALQYMDEACRLSEVDEILNLYFSAQRYNIIMEGELLSVDERIKLGRRLIKKMFSNKLFLQTRELHETIENYLELLKGHRCYDEALKICRQYIEYNGTTDDNIINVIRRHPEFAEFSFLGYSPLDCFSAGFMDTIHQTLYNVSRLSGSDKMYDYALLLIDDELKHLSVSMELNSIGSYQSDKFISLTSGMADRHASDTMKCQAYNAALLCKGLQMHSDFAIRRLIKESSHISALRKLDELDHIKKKLDTASEEMVDSLFRRKQEVEHDLLLMSEMFGDYTRSLSMTWKDVQAALDDNDIAIEFTYVHMLPHTENLRQGYYACVIKKGMSAPDIVYLSESLSTDIDMYSDCTMTDVIFGPFRNYMEGVEDVYFSPIKEINLISLESLLIDDKTGERMSDKYNMYRLSSTRELLIDESFRHKGSESVVYGGLKYAMVADDARVGVDDKVVSERGAVEGIPFLKASLLEAMNVTRALNESEYDMYKAEMLSGNAGTEASFKLLDGKGKRIIHIATHGFYFDDSIKDIAYIERLNSVSKYNYDDKAMFRSGLLFSGADYAWNGGINTEDIDDGILTSQEIANLDLTGLDLVVLSACDTVHGEMNSEGVFGLQRDFKKAGANSVLMSLWKVDDRATEQFMTSFYYHWLRGKSKIDALKSAQKHLLSIPKYSEPKYWAGFVLLDAVN